MIAVGQGMQQRMDLNHDHALYGHELGPNEDGSQYEKCWGSHGLYLSSNASGVWENLGPFWKLGVQAPILTVDGRDIRELIQAAAGAADVPPELVLSCAIAESDLDPHAERWGSQTADAKLALTNGDRTKLTHIIAQAGNDISFGLGQRIVIGHYFGNRQNTLDNVLAVRQHVFDNMDEDVRQSALFLFQKLHQALQGDLTQVGGDELLGALVAYNAGHYPSPGEAYWQQNTATVSRYKQKLALARQLFRG